MCEPLDEDELAASIPEEEQARLPRDLASNLDHYLYGAPKEKSDGECTDGA
jgi:hypothetical protein